MRAQNFFAATLAALVLAASFFGTASADSSGQRQRYHFSGSGGRLIGPLTLSGKYLVYVRANFEPWAHPYSSSCIFGGELRGLDRPVPPGYANWGSPIPVLDIPAFTRRGVVSLEPGTYQFSISPITECSWQVMILPQQDPPRTSGQLGIIRATIVQMRGGNVLDNITAIHIGEKYTLGVYLEGDPEQIARAAGSLSLMQGGVAVETIALVAGVASDGTKYLAREIRLTDPPDPERFGPVTFQITVAVGSTSLTRTIDATFVR